MSPLKQIDENIGDLFNLEEWYLVEPEEAEPEGEKEVAKEEDVEEEKVKEEYEEEEENCEEKGDDDDDDDDDDEDEDEEEEGQENLLIESKYSKTKMGSSSMDEIHHMFRRFQFSPLIKKNESKDIRILVKDHVLPFLPAKSLVRFRAVSKEWDRWIKSPFLAHQQSYSFQELSGYFYQENQENIAFLTMNRHAYGVPTPTLSFLPESVAIRVAIRSSSNGLVLCEDQNFNNTYYICNPVSKEWKELPRPHYYHGPETAIVLAFEPSSLNMDGSYQLICPVTLLYEPIIFFEVYSSTTRSWTESTSNCLKLEAGRTIGDNGFYVGGTAYWETSSRKVLAFNPSNDIHEIISLPFCCPRGGILTQMNEELCYIGISNSNGNDCFVEICGGLYLELKYKMKLDLQMSSNGYRVLPCLNGNLVMILNGRALHSYSLKDKELQEISWVAGRFEAKYLPYVNSLVSVG